ncbi:bromodomain adjacent to zinc finger domain protein 2A-like isoform X3 [Anguilla rostrata]|uniref:bromodomain adjacent to zinc finger domain protein 2A-like isoform X3 n=1 Tax=Anguilla rostrata TaxID=7938 RepID=UPI0030D456DD
MEANNHFNFGSHPAVPTNSGSKPSSGDSHYSNGSSISLPQPGKNMKSEVNVNGITTVKGPSQPHPLPSTPYTVIGHRRHHSELEYDYLWGQQQYSPPMGIDPGATLQQQEHRKSEPNGGLAASCPPNVTVGKGGYWNQGIPGQQHGTSPNLLEYSSHRAFQSHPQLSEAPQKGHDNLQSQQHHLKHKHPPSQQLASKQNQQQPSQQNQQQPFQHHQQQPSQQHQQQTSQQHQQQVSQQQHQHQPSLQQQHQTSQWQHQHQPSQQQHHQSSPQQQHQHQPSKQHQQQHPYGMMFSGISCFHQLAPHHSHPPAQVMPPFSESCAPQSSGPRQHNLGQRGSASHLSVQSSPAALENSTPQDNSDTATLAFNHSNGHMNEGGNEADSRSGDSEQFSVTQRLPKNEGLPIPQPTSLCHSQVRHTFVDNGGGPTSQWQLSRDPPCAFPSPAEMGSRRNAPNQQGSAAESDSSLAMVGPSLTPGGQQEVSNMNMGREVEASTPLFHSGVAGLAETQNGPMVSSGNKTPEHPPCIPQNSRYPDHSLGSLFKNQETANGIFTAKDSDESASHLEETLSEDSKLEELEEEDVQDTPGLVESAAVGVWMEERQKVPCDSPASSAGACAEEDRAFQAPNSHDSLCEKERKDDTEDGSESLDPSEDETSAPSLSAAPPTSSPASSPSNCQDPFCSHPYPPSPSPLPARPKAKRAKKAPKIPKMEEKIEDHYSEEEEVSISNGPRRRIATEEQVNFPLQHGWRREVRVRRCMNRLKGETWYYSPCGRRMKQFPEVIKYLKRQRGGAVSREHFSFSPRMPVGDFYEERETAEGTQWLPLADEEVPSIIMAITGRRGRPPNPDRERSRPRPRARRTLGGPGRRPGRPHGARMMDLLRKVDARLLQKLEDREILSEEEKEKLKKIRRKMNSKTGNKRKETKIWKMRQERRRVKLVKATSTDQEWEEHGATSPRPLERREGAAAEAGEDTPTREKRAGSGRSDAKMLARARAEKEAQAHAAEVARRQAERRAQVQRHLEERRRQQFFLEELKKPTEDMCLADHQPLPELPCVPGLVLSGRAFAHCLQVVEFLHSYGKVLALQLSHDVPSLATLQEGLLGLEGSEGELLDLLVQLVQAALHDPGLPSSYQSVKILGERLGDVELNPSSVSEGLRIFLESRGFEPAACASLCTRPFQAHSPDAKAAMLAFLVGELNDSGIVTKELDSTLEKMATYRKNKWIIEGKLRKLKAALAQEPCLEGQSRTSRTEETLEESLERSSHCTDKEEAQLGQGQSTSCGSVPDLERQIDKLTKRQVFFRKKLLQASHSLRAGFLGEDRYRRRYWALPRVGAILVEGSEEILGCQGDVFVSDEAVPDLAPVKKEPKPEPQPTPAPPPPPVPPPAEADPLPGIASLMSRPSGRGRPRKIKPEVELHLRTAKSRRHRRSSKAGREEEGGGAYPQHGNGVKEEAESLLPKTPALPSSDSPLSPAAPDCHATSLFPVCSTPLPRPGRRRGGGAVGPHGTPRRRGRPPSSLLRQVEQQYLSQLDARPIPTGMARGWWWVRGPEELAALLKALHPRGIREKALHKHLSKHGEYLAELCARAPCDPMFQEETATGRVSQALAEAWDGEHRTMEADLGVLQWVEDLEKRVLAAQLHAKDWALPEPDSTREDLRYHEHALDLQDDWVLKPRRERCALPRLPSNPLDLAVLRLGRLERCIQRRCLREPLWSLGEVVRLAPLEPPAGEAVPEDLESVESEITLRLRAWRQALDRCSSSAQLSLCLMQLEHAIAWETVSPAHSLSLAFLPPPSPSHLHISLTQSTPPPPPFCPQANGEQRHPAKQKSWARKRYPGGHEPGSSDEENPPRRGGAGGGGPRRDDAGFSSSPYSRFSGDSCSPAKRRRVTTRNQPDLTYCEIILMEMEAHGDAWPFLEPVNPRLVPGYRRVIKNPMDFLTMRERLLQGEYRSCEEFAADARLVFDNCELFNEDTSEVGVAGHSMRRFFESRWAEFYQDKGQ